jgi:hypothetical protein
VYIIQNSRKRINDVVYNRKSSCGYREEVGLCVSGDHRGWGFVNVQLQGFVCIDKNNLLSFSAADAKVEHHGR